MKISIITVVYNAADNLKKTLNSIRNQNYENIEFIVIDGASTDGSDELLKDNKDIISILISEPDKGLYDAMNKGKNLATGDFALFMNAGDIFVNNMVISDIAAQIDDKETFYHGNVIVHFDGDYKVAPNTHHQSDFFPKSFYLSEDYQTDKYDITAEGDYIYRIMAKYPTKHLDVDVIFSKIEGMRVHCYSTLPGMRKIYKEVMALMQEHSGVVPLSFKLTYPLKSLIKYMAFKIGGLPLVAKVLLSKYESSKRIYLIED